MRLVSISPGASNNPGSGHWYWFYKHLREYQASRGQPAGVTIGASGARCDHIIEAYRERLSLVKPLNQVRYFWHDFFRVGRVVDRLQNETPTNFQFYDGWLNEFLFACSFAKRFPNSRFLYNFHWATQWADVFVSRKPAVRLIRWLILRSLASAPSNLVLTAETRPFADKIFGVSGVHLGTYPVFAAFEVSQNHSWDSRKYDVALFPQQPEEVLWSVQLINRLKGEGLRTQLVCRDDTWVRSQTLAQALAVGEREPALADAYIASPLPTEAFQSLLGEARVVVLPYFDPYFSFGSSGKFNEAIACGAFPFAPATTAITTQSSGSPALHGFPEGDLEGTLGIIVDRLEKKFDPQLKPVAVEDLTNLVATAVPRTPLKIPLGWRTELVLGFLGATVFGISQSGVSIVGYFRTVKRSLARRARTAFRPASRTRFK